MVSIVALHGLDVADKGGLRGREEHRVVVARQAWNLQQTDNEGDTKKWQIPTPQIMVRI